MNVLFLHATYGIMFFWFSVIANVIALCLTIGIMQEFSHVKYAKNAFSLALFDTVVLFSLYLLNFGLLIFVTLPLVVFNRVLFFKQLKYDGEKLFSESNRESYITTVVATSLPLPCIAGFFAWVSYMLSY